HALPTCVEDGFSPVVCLSTLEASRTDKLANAFFGYSWYGIHGCVSMYLFCMVMDITAVYYHICVCVTRFRPVVLPMCPSCYNFNWLIGHDVSDTRDAMIEFKGKITEGGKIAIPPEYQQALEAHVGDEVVIRVAGEKEGK